MKTTVINGCENEWYGMIYECSYCNCRGIWEGFEYCPHCGKEIDWGK